MLVPIYAYRCEACGFAKDALQKVSDAPLTDCPACGAATFKKQLTAAGFQLKGTGWYVTDFRNGSSGAKSATPEAGKSEAGAASSSDGASSNSADSATASAPAATTGSSSSDSAGSTPASAA
jgi:putative FmdB family regulatory protein